MDMVEREAAARSEVATVTAAEAAARSEVAKVTAAMAAPIPRRFACHSMLPSRSPHLWIRDVVITCMRRV